MAHSLQTNTELLRFAYQAMATEFQILVPSVGADLDYLEQACEECFRDLEVLENELSRYRESSDICRINSLSARQSTPVGMAAFDCLSLAKALHEESGGAFDITVGPLMELWRGEQRNSLREPSEKELEVVRERVGSENFELSTEPQVYEVRVSKSHLSLDLGALGKGYALDQMARKLEEWQISSALLSAGESTIFALGIPPLSEEGVEAGWKVGAGGQSLYLENTALSGSGFEQQGDHIMNPRSGKPLLVEDRHAWAVAPSAAMADALSTAFLMMKRLEIQELCEKLEGVDFILPPDPSP